MNTTKTFCGTQKYMAPEILKGDQEEYDYKIDIWSMGILFFVLIFEEFPFVGTNDHLLYMDI